MRLTICNAPTVSQPENCLLTSSGYLKLVDFGLARRLDGPAFTLCGTPDYIAPEIISVSGHGTAVVTDWPDLNPP